MVVALNPRENSVKAETVQHELIGSAHKSPLFKPKYLPAMKSKQGT